MITEIITKSDIRYRIHDGKTKSIKWSDKYGCFLINNSVKVYMEDIKSLTCGESI